MLADVLLADAGFRDFVAGDLDPAKVHEQPSGHLGRAADVVGPIKVSRRRWKTGQQSRWRISDQRLPKYTPASPRYLQPMPPLGNR